MGGGKVKDQLFLRPVGTYVFRKSMKKAPEVQSGHALPMGKCASPPCVHPGLVGQAKSTGRDSITIVVKYSPL